MLKVLIVDDHALVRRGIRRLLDDLSDMTVVAEADSGEQALLLAKQYQPDVVLLDIKMPGIDGWEVTRRLFKTHPHVKVIAVTALSADVISTKILQLGAKGYLTKEASIEEMANAIRIVGQGGRYISAKIAQKMAINSLAGFTNKSPFELLSEREMQVALMITNGFTVQHISTTLFLSTKTINGYRYRIFAKLGIQNDVELTFLAIQHGIINQPESINDC